MSDSLSKLNSILIIGAGQMGNGIAHVASLAGKKVIITDAFPDAITKAIKIIEKNLARQVAGGKLSEEDSANALKLISAGEISDAANVDLVVEAVPENFSIKSEIYGRVVPMLSETALLASNTSSISITELAAASGIGDRFVGLHFFNPVPVMKLVEVIPGLQTSQDMVDRAIALSKELGKAPVVSKDAPAFITNRILVPMINEAIFVLQDGIAKVEDIDTAMKLGTRHPMGPLQLADYIGLDTCLSVLEVMVEATGDPKYRPANLLKTYVAAGWLGVKKGKGFYDYSGEKPVPSV